MREKLPDKWTSLSCWDHLPLGEYQRFKTTLHALHRGVKRLEIDVLACRLFALLHASLPGVPDLPTLRHILVRHLSSMQGMRAENTDDFQGRLPLRPRDRRRGKRACPLIRNQAQPDIEGRRI